MFSLKSRVKHIFCHQYVNTVLKSSRLDSCTDGLVVSVWLKAAPPRSEHLVHLLASRMYRKLVVRGFSQWPYTAQTYLVTATLAPGDLPGR